MGRAAAFLPADAAAPSKSLVMWEGSRGHGAHDLADDTKRNATGTHRAHHTGLSDAFLRGTCSQTLHLMRRHIHDGEKEANAMFASGAPRGRRWEKDDFETEKS